MDFSSAIDENNQSSWMDFFRKDTLDKRWVEATTGLGHKSPLWLRWNTRGTAMLRWYQFKDKNNSKDQDNYKKSNYMDQDNSNYMDQDNYNYMDRDNYNLDEFRHDRSCQERDSVEERVVSRMWRFPWLLDILISFQFTSCHIGFIWEGRRATMNSFFIHKLFFHSGTPLTQMRHSTLKIWLYYSPLQAKLSATRHHWDVQYICAPGLPWAPTKSRSREEDHGGSHGASRT